MGIFDKLFKSKHEGAYTRLEDVKGETDKRKALKKERAEIARTEILRGSLKNFEEMDNFYDMLKKLEKLPVDKLAKLEDRIQNNLKKLKNNEKAMMLRRGKLGDTIEDSVQSKFERYFKLSNQSIEGLTLLLKKCEDQKVNPSAKTIVFEQGDVPSEEFKQMGTIVEPGAKTKKLEGGVADTFYDLDDSFEMPEAEPQKSSKPSDDIIKEMEQLKKETKNTINVPRPPTPPDFGEDTAEELFPEK